jgi:hypothetical protein
VVCPSLFTRSHPRLTCASITGNFIVFGLYNLCNDGRRNVSRKGNNVSVFVYQPCRYNSTTALNLFTRTVFDLMKQKVNHIAVTPHNDDIM